MERRTFATLSLSSLAFALCPRSLLAQQAKRAAHPSAAPLGASEVVDKVQAFYDQLSTFKASFKQQFSIKSHGTTKYSAGSVIFQKPGKMSWRYTNNGNRVVSDGKLVKVYEHQNKQMFEQPLNGSQYPAALSFLTGQGKLKQNFTFTLQNSAQLNYTTGHVLLGQPLHPTAAYDRVYFYVDAKSFQVRRVIIVDTQQNKNRFEFDSAQANTKPPKGEFSFTPPPGTQVIRP